MQDNIAEIAEMLIQLCINPNILTRNKYFIAEVLEASFHQLAILIKKYKGLNEELKEGDHQEDYSISQEYSEGIIQNLIN